ncbi:hypothetical protein EJ04DRAFT_559783 [Polyplosphaeria fusca]|uniref:Uncharacterized protein n=1 Tax=Polyplosphaeria fusca TaxID=682080 RepID=A0A9P4V7C9_9PLEO|nr:hypothetical protein EJ04DRAFT_559783 [Polyplosphaeria fusca]
MLMASAASAQDVIATIWIYDQEKCAADPFSTSSSLTVFETNKVLSGGTWNCGYVQTGDTANHPIWVDQNTIPDGCSLVLYNGPPKGDDVHTGPCQTYYASISNAGGGCIKTAVDPDYGFALCCGNDCTSAPSPPPKRSLDSATKAPSERHVAAKRDVTAIKRTNPFNDLARRDDCAFGGKGGSITTFGTQVRLGPPLNCGASEEACSPEVQLSYTSSVTNTFGVSSEIGANLFEIISASVTFSVEVSHEESHGFTWSATASVPPGQSGYLTFQPKLECTPDGSFSGDCNGVTDGQTGKVCYQALVGGIPDGQVTFVQDV